MIFKRRNKRLTLVRLREYVVPKKGWKRAFEYVVHRLKRIPDSPQKISLGLSIGVFASFTPLFGLHFFLAGVFFLAAVFFFVGVFPIKSFLENWSNTFFS